MTEKAKVPRVEQNDWVRNPQPSYDAYSFDIKPSYASELYNIDVDELGIRGEQSHPIPRYAGLSGYSAEAKRKMGWYVSKIKGAKSDKEKKFYINKLNAYKKTLSKGSRKPSREAVVMQSKEKIIGGVLLFGLGYVVLNEIFG
jgi:hypothetical protein